MRIGLIDVDRTRFPNLALMKISAYHKAQGDEVEWANPMFGNYDRVYMSKIFTFTPPISDIYDCEIVQGGTGFSLQSALPDCIDSLQPDYSIYPQVDRRTAYGFLTRGCPNKCKWCVVPVKEGLPRPYNDVEEIAINGRSNLVLMDNNILASDYGLNQLVKIADKGYRVDFNQGLDARLITDDIAQVLARIRWIDCIRLACDSRAQIPYIERAYSLLAKHGYKRDIFCYFLISEWDDVMERLNALRRYKWFKPHGQPYRDFNNPSQVIDYDW